MFHKLTIFIIIACAVIMTGCANITYSHTTFPSGRIEEQIIVTLDTTSDAYSIKWVGFNTVNLLNIVKTDLDNNFLKDVIDFKNYISTNNNISQKDKEYINSSILASTDIQPSQNKVVSTITFTNFEVYVIYKEHISSLPINKDKVYSSAEITETPLINYYIQNKSDFFKATIEKYGAGSLTLLVNEYNNFSNIIADKKLGTVFNVSEISFNEIWAYPNLKATSNANESIISGNLKYHYWDLNNPLSPVININANPDLSLQIITTNHISWYILAIILSLISIIIVLFMSLFKKQNTYKTKIDYNV